MGEKMGAPCTSGRSRLGCDQFHLKRGGTLWPGQRESNRMDEPILISSLDGGTSIIDDYGSGSRVPHPGKSLRAQRWTARSWEDWAVSAKSPCNEPRGLWKA